MNVYSANELVSALMGVVGKALPEFTGYAEVLPNPELSRPQTRQPLFVVQSTGGTDARSGASVQVRIVLERAIDEGSTSIGAVHHAIRDDIAAVKLALFDNSGFPWGCRFNALTWAIYEADIRPVVQAHITTTFEVPRPVYNNNDFLV